MAVTFSWAEAAGAVGADWESSGRVAVLSERRFPIMDAG